jgi:hypothetical protein
MNERLKELYQQAHMVREYPADDPMRGGNPPTVYWGGERSAERFAELIVRHCALTVRMTEFGNNMTQEQIARHIEDHFFGVE